MGRRKRVEVEGDERTSYSVCEKNSQGNKIYGEINTCTNQTLSVLFIQHRVVYPQRELLRGSTCIMLYIGTSIILTSNSVTK